VKRNRIDAKASSILNQKSGIPLSTTNHCEKYKAKTMTMIELAKSYRVQTNIFFLFMVVFDY
jgi:hypothetical protein